MSDPHLSPQHHQPEGPPRGTRRILGLHPALFMGIALLAAVAILSIVLVFTGSIAQHGTRVFWTLVTFGAFTGLLALDLSLSRRTSRPLVLGTIANSYMIIALTMAIWIWVPRQHSGSDDEYWAGFELVWSVPLIIFVSRAAWALAWAVLNMGGTVRIGLGRVFGIVTAVLVGVAGVLLTLHVPLRRFGVEVDDWYWRSLVAVLILVALAACVLLLLVWNQRSEDRPQGPMAGHAGHGDPAAQAAARAAAQVAAAQAAVQAQQAGYGHGQPMQGYGYAPPQGPGYGYGQPQQGQGYGQPPMPPQQPPAEPPPGHRQG